MVIEDLLALELDLAVRGKRVIELIDGNRRIVGVWLLTDVLLLEILRRGAVIRGRLRLDERDKRGADRMEVRGADVR